MIRTVFSLPLLLLVACGPWPDVSSPSGAETRGTWPTLQPMDTLAASTRTDAQTVDVAEDLTARADALRRRAAVLRSPVTDQDSFDALRARTRP